MSDELYYILYWTGIAIAISGFLHIAAGYDPMIGTPVTFSGVNGLLLGLSIGGLVLTIRDMLSPKRASGETN